MEICPKCLKFKLETELHVCRNNLGIDFRDTLSVGTPATVLFGLDAKTEQINKLNDELKNEQTESHYKDEYINKLKKRNKKLLDKIQELYHKYLEKSTTLPQLYDEEIMIFVDDLLNEVVQDINDLLTVDK